ncbi:MAG: aspartate aminotransferase family protein [Melioribacteraceae bacterium]|nr:MAG: aspartate aminotransferase family protein [Melioribacteraceae bacterium]
MRKHEIQSQKLNEDFHKFSAKTLKFAGEYLSSIESYSVLPDTQPGELKARLPEELPEKGEDFNRLIDDTAEFIAPAMTHWNHPGFMAYFNSSASLPGIMGEILAAVFNNNAMVWKSGPGSTELEEVTLEWFRKLVRVSPQFRGFIYDTASVSVMHAFSAARENLNLGIREKGLFGRVLPKLKIYASEQAHSSIDKAALLLGTGLDGIQKIPVDENFAMIPEELEKKLSEDISNGVLPLAVVATIGTTGSTAIDPLPKIAEITNKYKVWLHVDAAHAGVVSMLPERKDLFTGHEAADSMVINPHKWMFVPLDLSVLFIKNPDVLKRAFSLVPEYLKTSADDTATNYMDYGIQLGRRFRSLKFWYVMRYFGREGLCDIIRGHLDIAHYFLEKLKTISGIEILAPLNFSTICFMHNPGISDQEELNRYNARLMDEINRDGRIFISHTKLNGKFTIRVVFSGINQTKNTADTALEIIAKTIKSL